MVKRGALRIDDNNEFDYDLKHFDKPSKFGIECGRISKLSLRLNGKYVAVYDRGWVIRPMTGAALDTLLYLLARYN